MRVQGLWGVEGSRRLGLLWFGDYRGLMGLGFRVNDSTVIKASRAPGLALFRASGV